METWYSLIRRHKKTLDKIKIGLKGKQTRKFMNVIRTAMAADKRCEKFYRGLAKVTPLFQPCFAWTKICVCPAMMKVTQSARKKSSSYCIFPFPGDFVQRRLIWRLFLRGRSTGSWRSRCGLLLERFSWLAKIQYQSNNSDQSQLCDEPIKIPSNAYKKVRRVLVLLLSGWKTGGRSLSQPLRTELRYFFGLFDIQILLNNWFVVE